MPSTVLPFTGERFTPECVREIAYEHWHRYAFVRALTAGKRVLDAACGEGYGSAFLAGVAAQVTGIDLDPSTIEHARARYADMPNLDFRIGAQLTFGKTGNDNVTMNIQSHGAGQYVLHQIPPRIMRAGNCRGDLNFATRALH